MFKKLLSVLFVMIMIFSCTTVVFATGDDLEILPADGYDVGDIDMNGKIDISDATKLQKYLVGLMTLSVEQLELADTNFDGGINIIDATSIQMHIVNLQKIEKPVQKPTVDPDKPIELPFVPAR